MLLEGIFREAGIQEEVRKMTRIVLHPAVSAGSLWPPAIPALASPPIGTVLPRASNSWRQRLRSPSSFRQKLSSFRRKPAAPALAWAPTAARPRLCSGSRLRRPLPGSIAGSGTTTAQFVAPKAKKDGSGGSTITTQFVVPKAKKAETEVIAKVDTPAKPLLLAPATTSTTIAVDQAPPPGT
jgi:hypothetical protein